MGLGITSKATRFLGALTATAVIGVGASLAAAPAAVAASPGPVQQTPALFTPWLLNTTVKQVVRQLVQCGSTMYAVGTVSAIGQGGSTYTRFNAFSFNATTGAMTSWAPVANAEVHTIALSPDCSTAYLGGHFTTVNGVTAKHLAAVTTLDAGNLSTDLKTGFKDNVNGDVLTAQYTTAHGLLIGGKFTKVNSVARTMLASVDPATGTASAYANLPFSGTYPGEQTKVFESVLSHSGTRLLITGVFTLIGTNPQTQARRQVAVLDLGSTAVTLDGWNSTEFNGNCVNNESFYATAANWSPDDGTIYVATTGFQGNPLCDAAVAFPSTAGAVGHKWINYTGGDSLFAVASDANDVYIAGHERWADNPFGHDNAGQGALSRPGLGALAPSDGKAASLPQTWNPTRSRGVGATELYITAAGLWVASDNGNDGTSQMCGGKFNKGGICFLPY
jgi:hypothetical protein